MRGKIGVPHDRAVAWPEQVVDLDRGHRATPALLAVLLVERALDQLPRNDVEIGTTRLIAIPIDPEDHAAVRHRTVLRRQLDSPIAALGSDRRGVVVDGEARPG